MNYVISIVNPKEMKKLVEISRKLEITMGVVFLGHGLLSRVCWTCSGSSPTRSAWQL